MSTNFVSTIPTGRYVHRAGRKGVRAGPKTVRAGRSALINMPSWNTKYRDRVVPSKPFGSPGMHVDAGWIRRLYAVVAIGGESVGHRRRRKEDGGRCRWTTFMTRRGRRWSEGRSDGGLSLLLSVTTSAVLPSTWSSTRAKPVSVV